MAAKPVPTAPYVSTPEEKEDLAQLRAAIHPEQTLQTLESFSTWMVSLAVLVGSLGSAFGVSGLGPLAGTGQKLFAAALVCLAVALALAVAARIPYRVTVNRWSLEDLDAAFAKMVKFKSYSLIGAGVLFAASLVLAALAPLFS